MNPAAVILGVALIISTLADASNQVTRIGGSNFPNKIWQGYQNSINSGSSEMEYRLPVKKMSSQTAFDPSLRSFDARQHWPECQSIKEVPDQGFCAASYAIVPTAVMTDRACIASNGTRPKTYSSFHVLACCTDCSYDSTRRCLGGRSDMVWQFWLNNGIASEDACLPYPFKAYRANPMCPSSCKVDRSRSVSQDSVRGERAYLVSGLEVDIRQEIFENGPVQAKLDLFSDFVTYTSGVYKHEQGELLGVHHVKLIGWGEEAGVGYWLGVNSFGSDWGEQGLFKIVRGVNHLNVEVSVHGGDPRV